MVTQSPANSGGKTNGKKKQKTLVLMRKKKSFSLLFKPGDTVFGDGHSNGVLFISLQLFFKIINFGLPWGSSFAS